MGDVPGGLEDRVRPRRTRQWDAVWVLLDAAPTVSPFVFWAAGMVEVTFEYMISRSWRPFDTERSRRELQRGLNDIPGVEIPGDRLALRPNFPLTAVKAHRQQFLDIMAWTFEKARVAASQANEERDLDWRMN